MNTWAEPLRAAAAYSKHGWPVDSRQQAICYKALKKEAAAERITRLLDCIDGRMTAEEISHKAEEALDYTRKTLRVLIEQEKVTRSNSKLPFLYWRV